MNGRTPPAPASDLSLDLRLASAYLPFRNLRGYQRLRRTVLAGSILLVFLAPLWSLGWANRESAGLAGGGNWARLAERLPQPAQSPVVGAPWTVAVFGIEFLDPVAFAGLAAVGAVQPATLLFLLPTLLLVALFGRFFCGWLCPYLPLLAASNALRGILARWGVPLGNVRLPRWVAFAILAGLLVATAWSGSQLLPLVYPPSLIAREVFRAVYFGAVGAGAWVVLGAFVFDTAVSQGGFCRTLCPGGAVFSVVGRFSPVKVVRTPPKCTDCTACDVICNLGQFPMTDRLDSGCERCGKCVSVCPTDALRFSRAAFVARGVAREP